MRPVELMGLPKPRAIEEVSFEALVASRLEEAQGRFDEAGIDYDVGQLATDPLKINFEVDATQDMLTRARINDAYRAQLLSFALGADLDHVAAEHGVYRLAGEGDDRLATRVVLKNEDRNSAGSGPRYEFLAMSADLRVKDVVAYTSGRDPTIRIPVLSTDNDGIADEALLAKVNAAVQDRTQRMLNDTIVVSAAARQVADIQAEIWMLPDATASAFASVEPALRATWAATSRLGRDLPRSWIISALHQPGVQRVNLILPAAETVVPFSEAVAIGAVALVNMGRAY